MMRRYMGEVVNDKEQQDGEVRTYGEWVITRNKGRRYVATLGSAMKMSNGNLRTLLNEIDNGKTGAPST